MGEFQRRPRQFIDHIGIGSLRSHQADALIELFRAFDDFRVRQVEFGGLGLEGLHTVEAARPVKGMPAEIAQQRQAGEKHHQVEFARNQFATPRLSLHSFPKAVKIPLTFPA